ncbi:MAG TPA: hypothetical protein QGG37_03180, partial [Chloroflexota bacterium]|nr:hypothetical protein [Chloroflexota bacterium]
GTRAMPRKRAVVMVMPEREMPGMKATTWDKAMTSQGRKPVVGEVSAGPAARSAAQSRTPPRMSARATIQGSRKTVSMDDSARIAMMPTPAVPTTMAVRRGRALPVARRASTSSSRHWRRRAAKAATPVPKWTATAKVRPVSSGESHPAAQGTRIRCPELLMGRNSVIPWTVPRMTAANQSMGVSGSILRVKENGAPGRDHRPQMPGSAGSFCD